MTIGGAITVLKIGEDYLPIGRADLSDLTDSEAGALLKRLMTSDHSNMFQNKRRKELDSVLESLRKKGYINLSERLVYLNFTHDLFKHFLAKEDIYINNNKKITKKKEPKSKTSGQVTTKKILKTENPAKALKEYFKEDDFLKRVSPTHIKIMSVLNEERAKWNMQPYKRWTAPHEEAITNALKAYSLDDILTVIVGYIAWLKETDPLKSPSAKNKMCSPSAVLKNMKGKLYNAQQRGTDVSHIEIAPQVSSHTDDVSSLYNTLILNWDKIQSKKVKIEFQGELQQMQIASMAYKKFKSKLAGKNPKYVDSSEELFRGCYKESTDKGGVLTQALDDLYINGHEYSVESISINV